MLRKADASVVASRDALAALEDVVEATAPMGHAHGDRKANRDESASKAELDELMKLIEGAGQELVSAPG